MKNPEMKKLMKNPEMKKLIIAALVVVALAFSVPQVVRTAGFETVLDATSVASDICVENADGPCLMNEAANSLNPTLIPEKNDLDTGISGDGENTLFLITGGLARLQITNTGLNVEGIARISNVVPSATVPNLWPRGNDPNTGIGLAGADQLSLIAGGVEGIRVTSSEVNTVPVSGATLNIRSATTELTGMSGATVTATNLIPAGAFIYGVLIRVTTTITGASAFTIGDGSDVDRWGTGIALAAGTTTDVTDFTAAGFGQFSGANDVVLTATTANFTAGSVRLVVHYIDLTPPSS